MERVRLALTQDKIAVADVPGILLAFNTGEA